MPAYRWTFVSAIANGSLHGQHGEEGGTVLFVIDGPVNNDGSAKLHAKGTVQPGKAGLVTQMKGNKYDYYIEAKFTDTTGTGQTRRGRGNPWAGPAHSSSQNRPKRLQLHLLHPPVRATFINANLNRQKIKDLPRRDQIQASSLESPCPVSGHRVRGPLFLTYGHGRMPIWSCLAGFTLL